MKPNLKQLFVAHKTKFLLSLVLLTVACGTLNVGVQTTVNSLDDFSHKVTITATDALAEMLMDPEEGITQTDIQLSGWNFVSEIAGTKATVEWEKSFEGQEAIQFLEITETNESVIGGNFKITQKDEGSFTTYRISLDVRDFISETSTPGSSTTESSDSENESQEQQTIQMGGDIDKELEEAFSKMITYDWALDFMGELVESNSDTVEGNQARWHFNMGDLEERGEMYLITRVKNKAGGGCNTAPATSSTDAAAPAAAAPAAATPAAATPAAATPAAATPISRPKATIKFADTQFESLWINNAVAQYVVKHGYGYPVESVALTTPGMQIALAKGDIDIQMETWEQNIQDWYDEEIGNGNIEDWGMTYEGGPQFFIIPKYIHEEHGINTVDDMKKHWKLFEDPEDKTKGAFQNCPIGWQCTEINTVKMEAYGLTEFYNIVSGGAQAALDAALKGAQLKKAPVFGYYWAPTSIMGAYDWHILEEPAYNKECWAKVTAAREDKSLRPIDKACAYETLPVRKSAHSGLKTKAPDLVDLFKKMNVGLEPINKTAAWAVEEDIQGDWEKAAVYYLRNFEDRWTSWMPEANAKKVKEALDGNSG